MQAETSYARSGDVHIAYQVVGNGPPDLVFVPGFVSHVERVWDEPRGQLFLHRLASFCRVILFDKRGTGLSDRVGTIPTLEQRMDDVRAVMDATGTGRAAIMGVSEGGPMSVLFAATYPERTSALILFGAMARRAWAADYPWGQTPDEVESRLATVEPSQHFACLLAWDTTAVTDQDVVALARHLLSTGCAYICCWGPDCERVHDTFDREDAEMRPNGPFVISTWHSDESLADALWHVLFNAFPDAAYSDTCRSTVAISIGAPQWAEEARVAFLDPKAFSSRLLGEEHA